MMLLNNTKRLDYIDWAKAIAIILIVLGNFMPDGSWPRALFYSFHVPIFGIIGGILFAAPKSWRELGKKSINIATRLLVPYVIFFAVCCSFYFMPEESMPSLVAGSATTDFGELLKYFVFYEGKTVWNVTLSFMPCYIVISLVFLLFAKLTKGRRDAAFALASALFLALIIMEKKEFTIDIGEVKNVFGMKNYFLMLGFYAIGYALRPMLDICQNAFLSPKKNPFIISSICAFCMLTLICIRFQAVEITEKRPAGYTAASMYSGVYNGMAQFIAFALLLSVTLIIALMILPKCRPINLISRSSLFIMFAHVFVFFDKTFTSLFPYEVLWEVDMKIAYRDAASVMVILLIVLAIFDAIQKKFPKTRYIFTSIGIK